MVQEFMDGVKSDILGKQWAGGLSMGSKKFSYRYHSAYGNVIGCYRTQYCWHYSCGMVMMVCQLLVALHCLPLNEMLPYNAT